MKTALRGMAALLAMAPPLALAQARSQTAPSPAPPAAFQTPSGNIHCLFRDGRMRCDVVEFAYDVPPRPRDCRGDWGAALSLGPQGPARLVCTSRTIRNEEAFVLGYGARWVGRAITCESDEAGLRCANRAGQGFRVSRSRLEVF
ncbi:MAG: hypothetical protein K2X11_05040 [Acetobacteraceae bacterium]|nr:hypothetical protein [Acetobacteraceae bacterium]